MTVWSIMVLRQARVKSGHNPITWFFFFRFMFRFLLNTSTQTLLLVAIFTVIHVAVCFTRDLLTINYIKAGTTTHTHTDTVPKEPNESKHQSEVLLIVISVCIIKL